MISSCINWIEKEGCAILVIRLRTVILYLVSLVVLCCTVHIYGMKSTSQPVVAEGSGEGISVPILMYHGVTEDQKKIGKYVISSKMLEKDLLYLQSMGYQTVTIDEIIHYVKEEGDLPKRPIVLTFDDGYYNNYCYAYPLLQKYQMKAVISPIGKYSDIYSENEDRNPAYAHITWDNIREMMASGLVEFQNHSYDLHYNTNGRVGAKKIAGETQAAYSQFLESDLLIFQEKMKKNTGYTPTTFTYPYGGISEASFEVLQRLGFEASLSCEEKMNIIVRGDTACLQRMKRYLRTPDIDAEEILCHATKSQ